MKKLKKTEVVQFKIGDTVYSYVVLSSHLSCYPDSDNGIIFEALGLTEKEKKIMASEYYGYDSGNGSWPEYGVEDYEAATNLVKRLYDLCNIHNTK